MSCFSDRNNKIFINTIFSLSLLLFFGLGLFFMFKTHKYLDNDSVLCFVNDTSICQNHQNNNTSTDYYLKDKSIGVTFQYHNHNYSDYISYQNCYCQSECCQTEMNEHQYMTCFTSKSNSTKVKLMITGYNEIINPYRFTFFMALGVDILIGISVVSIIIFYIIRRYNRDRYSVLINSI